MTRDDVFGGIRSATGSLQRTRLALTDPAPNTGELMSADLEHALGQLEALCTSGDLHRFRSDALLIEAAHQMQKEMLMISALLEQACCFRSGWLRVAALLAGGYTAQGEPTPLNPEPRVQLKA